MEYRNQRIRFYALMAVSVFSALTSRNMMLVAGLAIVILFYISKMYKATKIFCMRNYLIAGIVANLLYIFFTAVLIASDLGKALLAATGKSATLSGRASILIPYTLLQIKEAPIFGHGVLSNEVRVGMYGGGKALIHAHNQVLEIAFIGGAVLLVLFVLLHLAVNKKLMAKKQYPASQVLSLFIFVLLFMTLFEVYTRRTAAGIWCIIALSYYVRELHQCFCNRSDFSMRRQVPDRKYRR